MINIPIWLFVIFCIISFIALVYGIVLLIDFIAYMIYQEHEWKKYKNKINTKE